MNLLRFLLLSLTITAVAPIVNAMPPKKTAGRKTANKRQREQTQPEEHADPDTDEPASQGRRAEQPAATANPQAAATECVICMDEDAPVSPEEQEAVRGLFACGHTNIHRECLMRWATQNGGTTRCPQCRAPQTEQLQEAVVGLVGQLRGQEAAVLTQVLEPINAVIVRMARDRVLNNHLRNLLRDLTIIARHPQQFERQLTRVRRAQRLSDTIARHTPSVLEGARQFAVTGIGTILQYGNVLTSMFEPSPVDLPALEQNAMTGFGHITSHYGEALGNAVFDTLRRAERLSPDLAEALGPIIAAAQAHIGVRQLQPLATPFLMPLLAHVDTIGDLAERAGDRLTTYYRQRLDAQTSRACDEFLAACRELGALVGRIFNA